MAVFPENMDKLDLQDTEGSLRRIENYIRYMAERVEFSNTNTTRTVTAAGVSAVGLYNAVVNLQNAVSVLNSNINTLGGTVTAMGSKVNGIEQTVSDMEQTMNTLSGDIEALAERVAALETPAET